MSPPPFGFAELPSSRSRGLRVLVIVAVIGALGLGGTAVVNARRAIRPSDGPTTLLRPRPAGEVDGTTSTSTAAPGSSAGPPTTAPTTGAGDTTPSTAAPRPSGGGGIAGALKRGIVFGLGPEANEARSARLVREAPVGMLTSWYKGPGDLAWMTGWRTSVVPETYASGKALHLIVWTGDAEGPLTTAYGPACGRGYPLSDRFLGDMEALARTFAGTGDGPPLYVTLFTELQTFPCVDNQWNPDAETTNYYKALKDRYRDAYSVFHRVAPNAKVSLGWGGWQARWDAPATGGGRSLIAHFDDVLRLSEFQSFHALAADSNLDDVRAMTRLLGAYGPVMVSHYQPDHGSSDAVATELRTMLGDPYLDELRGAGLFAFSFLDHTDLSNDDTLYQLAKTTVNRRGIPPP